MAVCCLTFYLIIMPDLQLFSLVEWIFQVVALLPIFRGFVWGVKKPWVPKLVSFINNKGAFSLRHHSAGVPNYNKKSSRHLLCATKASN